MTTFRDKPEQAQWLTPYAIVQDMDKSLTFYQTALGLDLKDCVNGPDGEPLHAELAHKGKVILMCAPEGAFGGTAKAPLSGRFEAPNSYYLYVDDVDAAHERAKAAGAKIDSPPEDMFWGDRTFRLTDPSGFPWMIASHIGMENAPPPPDGMHS